ncbi:MAG: orotidine-5'-phosphate decarboxylase [Bacteroidales bacterium]|nr:orotidine-5'-phosphate decarboxylase [Bacteroidales bacterium]
MDSNTLFNNIKKKKSFLCVGLDSDIEKIPVALHREKDPVFRFNKEIIDATNKYVVAYKPNIAFYESRGADGWVSLENTVEYIRSQYPEIFLIADAKRGDIGNTSKMYAKTFFEHLDFDAITVAPYMGEDSVSPFLEYPDKWVILLALTSNSGANDFQFSVDREDKTRLFEKVLQRSSGWGTENNMMYVVGATKAEMLRDIRKIIPEHFLLVPGIGSQGGSLEDVAEYGINNKCGLIVNSSRGIIFADNSGKFAQIAGEKAKTIALEMSTLLFQNRLL